MTKAGASATLRGRVDTGPWWDPFRFLWRLFTSVRFAFLLTGTLAFAGLLGVVIPQVPIPMRGNDVAVSAWLDFQAGKFGVFTGTMHWLGLFNVFNSWWFRASMVVLVVSVTVCTVNRLPPTLRNVFRPPERVPDQYFSRARSRLAVEAPVEVEELRQALRRRRYAVRVQQEGETAYLFADRFPWAQLFTFVSHMGLIVILAGVAVSLLLSRETQVLIAEGTTSAVGGLNDRRFMQVQVVDAYEGRDTRRRIVDYHTDLAVYQRGEEICRGRSTVNSPLSCDGFRFHQSFFDSKGAQLSVTDIASGRLLYKETLRLTEVTPLPGVFIQDAATGQVLLDDYVPMTDAVEGTQLAPVALPDGRTLFIGVRPEGDDGRSWSLIAFEVSDPVASATSQRARLVIAQGDTAIAGGLRITFGSLLGAPAVAADLPGAEDVVVQMPVDRDGKRYLSLVGVGPLPVVLQAGEAYEFDGRRYTFEGQRNFAGLTVRNDPGSTIIWIAGGMLIAGLVATFYLPRRRLWVKVTRDRTYFAGQAERTAPFPKELRSIARDAGARIEPNDDDDDEE